MPAETTFQPAAYLRSRFASHLPSALRDAMSRPSYAVRQGTVGRNVAKMVERVRQGKKEMRTWPEAQARAFLATVESDRLSPPGNSPCGGSAVVRCLACVGPISIFRTRH